jgi:hypothetical protein
MRVARKRDLTRYQLLRERHILCLLRKGRGHSGHANDPIARGG